MLPPRPVLSVYSFFFLLLRQQNGSTEPNTLFGIGEIIFNGQTTRSTRRRTRASRYNYGKRRRNCPRMIRSATRQGRDVRARFREGKDRRPVCRRSSPTFNGMYPQRVVVRTSDMPLDVRQDRGMGGGECTVCS